MLGVCRPHERARATYPCVVVVALHPVRLAALANPAEIDLARAWLGVSCTQRQSRAEDASGPVLALLSGGAQMATLTIRQVDERTHALLRGRAARHGRSVEAEVRAILDSAVNRPSVNLLAALREVADEVGGVDLSIPQRTDAPRGVDLT